MHSSSLLFFLFALTGMVSGTIYFFAGAPADKLQTQLNLINHAYKHKNGNLLSALVHSGSSAARAVKSFGAILEHTNLESAAPHTETSIQGIVSFKGSNYGQGSQTSKFKLTMIPCKKSPTGYILKDVVDCKDNHC